MNTKGILKHGDTIAVITPSESFKKVNSIKPLVEERLHYEFGLNVIYGKNVMETDFAGSSSISSRVQDLHDAFSNPKVKAILCATGGYNTNDLLPYIDWNIIKQNPKPFIGSSDISVLLNAIYAKTLIVTYYSPNFYKFGMKLGLEYTIEYFKKSLMSSGSYEIEKSKFWSNDKWYKNQDERVFNENTGYTICSDGSAVGTIIGGNLCSLNLLQGTEYMPDLMDKVLFIEDDDLAGEACFGEFSRNLQSLLQLPSARGIKGIVVGRFPPTSLMTPKKIKWIFDSIQSLKGIPTVANLDFGHCDPSLTFPIGGKVEIIVQGEIVSIKIYN